MEDSRKSGVIFFNAYRYLLVAQDHIQGDFYTGVTDKETLNKEKNGLFEKMVRGIDKKSDTFQKFRTTYADEELLILKMGMKKHTTIGTPELTDKKMDDWHTVFLIFNFKKQMLLIQHKTKISKDTGTIARKIADVFTAEVEELSLTLQMNAIPKANYFWDMVEKYNKRIKEVDFVLTAPNFSEITKHLGDELKAAMQTTAAAQAKLSLVTDNKSALALNKDDENLSSMVKYSQAGGGHYSFKMHGLKRKTSKEGLKVLSIDSIHLEGNVKNLMDIPLIKELFNDAEN